MKVNDLDDLASWWGKSEDNYKVQQQKEYDDTVNSIKSTIKNGFNGISLNGKELDEFSNYITKSDDNRFTEADKAFYNLDVESKLTIDYIIKKGLIKDIAKFVSGNKNTTTTKKDAILKDLEKNNGRINLGNRNNNSGAGDKIINIKEKAYVEDGYAINSDFINDYSTKDAKKIIINKLVEKKIGNSKIIFRLKDAGKIQEFPKTYVYLDDKMAEELKRIFEME